MHACSKTHIPRIAFLCVKSNSYNTCNEYKTSLTDNTARGTNNRMMTMMLWGLWEVVDLDASGGRHYSAAVAPRKLVSAS